MVKLLKAPKSYFNQSIKLRIKTGQNNYQEPTFEDVSLTNCLVQPQTIYSGSNNGRTIVANALVVLYAPYTTPMPELNESHLGSQIVFSGHEYELTNIVTNYDPYSNEVWSYELEVL